MNNVHDDEPVVFQTRWAMSYLRGPLTRDQIKVLMDPLRSQFATAATSGAGRATTSRGTNAASNRPILPAGIREAFLPVVDASPTAIRSSIDPASWAAAKSISRGHTKASTSRASAICCSQCARRRPTGCTLGRFQRIRGAVRERYRARRLRHLCRAADGIGPREELWNLRPAIGKTPVPRVKASSWYAAIGGLLLKPGESKGQFQKRLEPLASTA